MQGLELLERLQGLGVHVEATGDKLALTPGSRVPPDLLAQVKESKALILAYLKARPIIEEAFRRADQVGDILGSKDAVARQINRLSWAVMDLQDAGEPEEVWKPLQDEERRWSAGGHRKEGPVLRSHLRRANESLTRSGAPKHIKEGLNVDI